MIRISNDFAISLENAIAKSGCPINCSYLSYSGMEVSRSRDLNFKVSVSRLGEKFGSRSRSNWISVSKQKLRLETSVIGTTL